MDNVRAYSFGEDLIVELSGEHDMSTIPHVEPTVTAALTGRAKTIFDLSEATYIDSSVLSMLLRMHKRLGDQMRVVVTDETRIRHLLEVTQMDRYLAVFGTLRDALESLPQTQRPSA